MLQDSFILPAFVESGIALGPGDTKKIRTCSISVPGTVTLYQGLVLHTQFTVILCGKYYNRAPEQVFLNSEEEQIVQ